VYESLGHQFLLVHVQRRTGQLSIHDQNFRFGLCRLINIAFGVISINGTRNIQSALFRSTSSVLNEHAFAAKIISAGLICL